MIFRHTLHNVVHDDFLVGYDINIFARKLRYADTHLILDIFVRASTTADGLSDTRIDLGAFLTSRGDDRAGGNDFNSCRSHQFSKALFGDSVLCGVVLVGFLLQVDFLVVEVRADVNHIHYGLVNFGDFCDGLHRHEQIVFVRRVLIGNNQRSIFFRHFCNLLLHFSKICDTIEIRI